MQPRPTSRPTTPETGRQNLADKLARLGEIDVFDDNFGRDTPSPPGDVPSRGEDGLWDSAGWLAAAKKEHRREGAAHVFSSWSYETPQHFGLDDVDINDNISVRLGNIVYDNTLPEDIIAQIEGEYQVKVKLIKCNTFLDEYGDLG